MEINIEKIQSAIVADAVDKIIGDDDLWRRVKDGIEARINAAWSNTVEAKVTSLVEQAVADGFDRAYRKVDQFGRAQGELTTVGKELNRLVADYWTQRVDRNGKPTDNSYSSTSRAEWMMVQICGDKFSETMKQHVVNVGGAVKDHFRAELNKTVNVLLSEVFHVKSYGDQTLRDSGRAVIDPPAKPVGI